MSMKIAATRQRGDTRYAVGSFLANYGLLLMLGLLVALFATVNPGFLTAANLRSLLEQNAALAIVAVGTTFAIISRNIDLSPGSLIALSGVAMALVFTATGNIVLGLLGGLAVALAVELFNAVLITWADIDPLIVTLAAWIWVRGLAVSLTDANSVVVRDPFIDFMNGFSLFGVTPPIALIALAYLAGWFLLNKTRLGRYAYALGGDERATRQAGVNTTLYKVLMFLLFGVLVWLGAIVTVSRLGAAAPDAAYGLELDAIVAVIIGGTAFQGGEGSLRRTAVGVLFIAVLNNGLSTMGMRDASFYAFKGSAILLALLFEVLSRQMLRGGAPVARVVEPAA
jgi:ribose/xylose/arabinose/galactoside ABC-type transport system permease subunit